MVDAKELGLDVRGGSGNEQYVVCPMHEDHSPSASFNRTKGVLYCYVCGRAWTVEQLQDALEIELVHSDREPVDFDLLSPDENFDLGDLLYAPYFEERGVLPSTAYLYGLRWKESPKAAVLPITSLWQSVQGVAYRYLEGSTRYRVFGKTTPVWPLHLLQGVTRDRPILVMEGAWSAMKIASWAGMAEVLPLALLGAKANQGVVDLLRSFNVTFLYDGDSAGEKACRKMRTLLPSANSWTVPISPDDMSEEQLEDLFEKLHCNGAFAYGKFL